jgi:hypothetical protein
MAFQTQAIGAKGVFARTDSPVRKKFLVMMITDRAFYGISSVKEAEGFKPDSGKKLEVFSGNEANQQGNYFFHWRQR